MKTQNILTLLAALILVPLMTGCNSIHNAAARGDLEQVRAMLKSDPTAVNKTDGNKCTPLHRAAQSGRQEMVEFLLDSGAKVNAVSKQNGTALYYVC